MPKNQVNDPIAQQETEGLRRQSIGREQVLNRLWEIANLSHEATRSSASAQIKALSLIIAIEGLIPDRRAASPEKKPVLPPADYYKAKWLREQEAKDAGTWVGPDIVRDEAEPTVPPSNPVSNPNPEIDPDPDPSPLTPHHPYPPSTTGTRHTYAFKKNQADRRE